MTDVKKLIEKIKQNLLTICDIDWDEETNDYAPDRLRELIFNIPKNIYEPLRSILVASYNKKYIKGPGRAWDDYVYDLERFSIMEKVYEEKPTILNYLCFCYIEREWEEKQEKDYEQIKEKVISFLKNIKEEQPSEEASEYNSLLKEENSRLRIENIQYKDNINRLQEKNKSLEEEKNGLLEIIENKSYDFTFGLKRGSWTEIIYALSSIAPSQPTKSGHKYNYTQIAEALTKFTGFKITKLRTRDNNSSNLETYKAEAKKFLTDIANKI